MSPNEISSGFNNILIFSSSESSDSESFLEEDLKSTGNYINKQWEAIERTLYQESGQQVTDLELLKECKLWRETFPHFRIKGTKIDLSQSRGRVEETEKSIQTIKNHFDFKKLEEKRESIKKKVVGELVERLIAKYGFEKEENMEVGKKCSNGVQITEINDENSEMLSSPLTKNNISNEVKKNPVTSSIVSPNKESYFERGKQQNQEILPHDEGLTVDQMEKNLYEIFNSWEEEFKTAKLSKSCDSKKDELIRQNFTLKNSPTPTPLWYKPKKFIPPSDSLSNIEKPYEVTKKIDRKYEGLIQKIMERKLNEVDPTRHCRSNASRLEVKSYQESLEKLRRESGFNDYLNRKNMPKLNNFNNNWLKRGETNYYVEDNFFSKKTQNPKPTTKKNYSNLSGEKSQNKIEGKFLEGLEAELTLHYKKPLKKNGIMEEINLQRPKPFAPATEKSIKSSIDGHFAKKNKKEIKNRQHENELEVSKNELNFKNRIKHNKLNNIKGSKSKGNQNQLLPPIESGLICKEIKKMDSKNINRRY